jgi:hypothetical protein
VAQVKNYGLIGVGNSLQLGKQGPKLKGNADASLVQIVGEDNATLTRLQGANGSSAADFVTKAQLDAQGSATDGFSLTLGNIDATGDGDWHITPNQGEYAGNTGVTRQGAVTTLSNTEKVSDAIDKLNEATLNVFNNTYVRDVDYTTDVSSGGAPLTATLTISTTGNPNRYTIAWGDGTTTTATTDSTPTHTYSNNALSPFDVTVTAFNNTGAGEGSSASLQKDNFITLYTANPVAGYGFFAASSGGGAVTQVDDGTALYFENQTTNIGSASATYKIEWGDGSSDNTISADTDSGGTQGSRLSHTFTSSTETDRQRTVKLTLLTHTTADPSTVPNNTTAVVNVFDTHTPSVTLDDNSGINESATSGHQVTFTNTTESGVGTYAAMGIQYRYVWGDGTTSTVNVGSGSSGDTSGTIGHTYALSGGQQSAGTAVDFVGNLEVISNHTSSPFKSSNFTVHVEPDLRATVTGTSVSKALRSSNDSDRVLYKGTDLSGTNRAVVTVDNTTQNANAYVYAWGDGSSNDNVAESGSPAGSVGGANITHDYSSQNAGSYTLTMTGSGQPDLTVQSDNDTVIFSLENVPAAPTSVSGQSLTLSTSAQDTSKLAHGATNAVGGISAGQSLNATTARRYDSTTSISTNTIDNAWRSDSGTLSALIDGAADGAKAFSTSVGETGTFTSLVITSEGDAYNEISSTTYPQNFYQVFTGRVTKDISGLATGVHSFALSHSSTGATNNVYIVKDNVTSTPTINVGSANLAEHTAGSKRYVSGIPYYNSGSPKVKLQSATVSNLVGEAFLDSTNIFYIASGTNAESTSGSAVQQEFRSYSDIDGSSTMLNSGVPIAQTGVASPYALGDVTVDITSSSVATVEAIKFRATNVNGTGSYTSETSEKIQVWTASPTFDEENIAVSDSLGAGHDDDGKRITGFGAASDTPSFNSSTNNYTGNVWTGAQTIAGTSEAVVRWNTLQHFDTDLSSGYLPVGPDLNTSRSGAQYFTFAFRRTTMANFTVRLTGKVSGFFVAAPGTSIDSTSGTNGWIDGSTTYGGAGTPGSNTGAGGNGSNGCAFTSGDRIIDGTNYSNATFTMTLGDQNGTDATGNNILVRIKLEDGDSLTALSIE